MSYFDALGRMATVTSPLSRSTTVQPLEQTDLDLVDPVQIRDEPTAPTRVEGEASYGENPDPKVPEPPFPTRIEMPAPGPSVDVPEAPPGPMGPQDAETPQRIDRGEAETPPPPESSVGAAVPDPRTRHLTSAPAGRHRSSPDPDTSRDGRSVTEREDALEPPGLVDHPTDRLATALRVVRRWVEDPVRSDPGHVSEVDQEQSPQVSRIVRPADGARSNAVSPPAEPVDLTIGTIHVTAAEPVKPAPEQQAVAQAPDRTIARSDGGPDRPIDMSRHYIRVR